MNIQKYIPWLGASWTTTLLINLIMFPLLCTFDLTLWLLQGGKFNPPLFGLSIGILIVLILVATIVEYRMGKPYREAQKARTKEDVVAQYLSWGEWKGGKIFGYWLLLFIAIAFIEVTPPSVGGDKITVVRILQCLLAAFISALTCTLIAYSYYYRQRQKHREDKDALPSE